MTLNQAIRERYGLRLAPILTEFKIHRFVIDRLRIGFAIPVARGGMFGCVMDGESWALCGGKIESVVLALKNSADIQFERLVWEIGRDALERGEELNEQDNARLDVAIKRLEEWL